MEDNSKIPGHPDFKYEPLTKENTVRQMEHIIRHWLTWKSDIEKENAQIERIQRKNEAIRNSKYDRKSKEYLQMEEWRRKHWKNPEKD